MEGRAVGALLYLALWECLYRIFPVDSLRSYLPYKGRSPRNLTVGGRRSVFMGAYFGGPYNYGTQRTPRILVLFSAVFFFCLSGLVAYYALIEPASSSRVTDSPQVESVEPFLAVKMVQVFVPIQEIKAGTALEPWMFRRESRPQVGVPEGALEDITKIESRYARGLLLPGLPLTRGHISENQAVNEVTAQIPVGFRAITIPTDSIRGGLFVGPGSKVDVNWITHLNKEPVVIPLVQNVLVLATNDETEPSDKNAGTALSTVTLLLSVEDAKRVQLCQNRGEIRLSLRGDGDEGTETPKPMKLPGSQNRKVEDVKRNGTLMMDGTTYYLIGGKLVPAEDVSPITEDTNFF